MWARSTTKQKRVHACLLYTSKLPFITNVVKIDNRVLKTEVSSSSASKDLQTVNSTIALNYRIGRANSASIYQNIGTDFENVLINPAIQECVKSVTAQFTACLLYTSVPAP